MVLTSKLNKKSILLRNTEIICSLFQYFVRDTSSNRFKLAIFGIHLALIYFVLCILIK